MTLHRSNAWRDLQARWSRTDDPTWFLLPWLLMLAFALRLLVSLTSDYVWRPDELATYLEQAHRVVYGYGIIPWDIDLKLRSWVVASIPIAVLEICNWVGFDHPDQYIPVMRTFNATFSLAIPLGTYVLCRRTLQESTARIAFVVSCFWYELVVMAPHTLSEFYSTYIFFAAASLIKRFPSPSRVALIGFLLGVAVAFRPHYTLSIFLFGLLFLCLLQDKLTRLYYIAGGIAACIAWGLVDRLTLGGWWVSIFNYLFVVTDYYENTPYTAPSLVERLPKLFIPSLGLFYIALLWGVFVRWKLLFPILLPLLGVLAFHLFINLGPEYSNFLLAVALAIICISEFVSEALAKSTENKSLRKVVAIVIFSTLTGLSFSGLLPGLRYTELAHNRYFSNTDFKNFGAYRIISRLPSKNVKGVFFDLWASGGTTGAYYYLHHRVPLFIPGTSYERIVKTIGYEALLEKYVSHVVTIDTSCFKNYVEIGKSGVWHVLEQSTHLATSTSEPTKEFLDLDVTPAASHNTLKEEQLTYYSWRNSCRE